jgi:hypothetical protein
MDPQRHDKLSEFQEDNIVIFGLLLARLAEEGSTR